MAQMIRIRGFLLTGVMGLGLLGVACGGGGDGGGNQSPGQRITDPALVPSSTPVAASIDCNNPSASSGTCYKISGDQVEIRGTVATVTAGNGTPTSGGRSTYTVKAGDLCGTIAAEHGITLEELLKANRTIDESCSNLHEGDELIIPGAAPATTPAASRTPGGNGAATPTPRSSGGGTTHTVASGETCEDIAAQYGVTPQQIITANPEINGACSNLQLDQVVKIP